MNKRDNLTENGKDVLWVNQYSMFRVQFSFTGLMAIFPKEVTFFSKN